MYAKKKKKILHALCFLMSWTKRRLNTSVTVSKNHNIFLVFRTEAAGPDRPRYEEVTESEHLGLPGGQFLTFCPGKKG